MTNKDIAIKLVELVGGKDNVKSVTNCMTRCRFELNNFSKANVEEIKKSEGVLGVVKTKEQLQVIYGPGKVNKVTEEVKKVIGTKVVIGEDAVAETKAKLKEKNDTKFKNILKKLGNVFIPLIPLFVACGLVLAINNIAGVYFKDAYTKTTAAQIIGLIGNGVFSILSVLVGRKCSKRIWITNANVRWSIRRNSFVSNSCKHNSFWTKINSRTWRGYISNISSSVSMFY